MVFRDDALREFKGGFVAVLELPTNARVVGVDGAVIFAAECGIAVLRPEVEFYFRRLLLFHLFTQTVYLLLQLGNALLRVLYIVEIQSLIYLIQLA